MRNNNYRPESGSNKCSNARQLSLENSSQADKLAGNCSSSSHFGPSSPSSQNADFMKLNNSLSSTAAITTSEAKSIQQKSYPVIYGELVVLGYQLFFNILFNINLISFQYDSSAYPSR